jgi:outer membrane protein
MNFKLKTTSLCCAALLWGSTLMAQNTDKPEQWTLESCVEYARAHNLTIKGQELNVLGQEANLRQQRASQLPSVNMSSSAGRNFGLAVNPVTDQAINQSFSNAGFSANSSVTIFNGFRLRNSILQQRAEVEASKYELEKAKNDIALNVINAYLNVIFNQELLDNAKSQLESTTKQVERTEKLVNAGALAASNLLEIKAQQANLEYRLVNAENSLALAFIDLKQILQLPADEEMSIVRPEVEVKESKVQMVSPVTVYETARSFMPEIKSAAEKVKSATLGVKVARGNYSPRLSAGAGISTNYSYLHPMEGVPYENDSFSEQLEENLGENVGVSLSIPIFNGLQTRTGVQRANIVLQQAELNQRNQNMQLRQTIERAYSDALAASKNYEAAEAQVEAMQEVFRITEEKYVMGASNSVDFLLASNNLNQAKSDLVRAKYEYIFKTKLLDFYQGNTLY